MACVPSKRLVIDLDPDSEPQPSEREPEQKLIKRFHFRDNFEAPFGMVIVPAAKMDPALSSKITCSVRSPGRPGDFLRQEAELLGPFSSLMRNEKQRAAHKAFCASVAPPTTPFQDLMSQKS